MGSVASLRVISILERDNSTLVIPAPRSSPEVAQHFHWNHPWSLYQEVLKSKALPNRTNENDLTQNFYWTRVFRPVFAELRTQPSTKDSTNVHIALVEELELAWCLQTTNWAIQWVMQIYKFWLLILWTTTLKETRHQTMRWRREGCCRGGLIKLQISLRS